MNLFQSTYRLLLLFVMALSFVPAASAQDVNDDEPVPMALSRREKKIVTAADSLELDTLLINDAELSGKIDSIQNEPEYVEATAPDSASNVKFYVNADSLAALAMPKEKGKFIPDPKKAMWLAIVFPGGGQIYNRKYWKLPLIYGGFLGCVYAMTWNNTMYRDYSQAYIDIMDSDDNTKSYENFLPPKYDVSANMERLKSLFKRKKDYYRRYRDLSMFCMIGVYALSIVDAYVDAEMSSFDISHDLSMKVKPTIINDRYSAMRASGYSPNSYGLQCSFSFGK